MRSIVVKFPLIFGMLMTILQAVVVPLLMGSVQLRVKRIIVFYIVYTITGFILVVLNNLLNSKNPGKGDRASQTTQQQQITLLLPYEKAFKLCKESLVTINGRVVDESYDRGVIKAKTRMTWRSFGEVIKYNLRHEGAGLTAIEVNSSPVLHTTLLDYGKNWENVEKITRFLSKHDSQAFLCQQRITSPIEDPSRISLNDTDRRGQSLLKVNKE